MGRVRMRVRDELLRRNDRSEGGQTEKVMVVLVDGRVVGWWFRWRGGERNGLAAISMWREEMGMVSAVLGWWVW